MSGSRGKQKLYNHLVESSVEQITGSQSKRNQCLEVRRDKMACRFYFHAVIRRLRYDDCLLNLHLEFDLMTNTIVKELETANDRINTLNSNKTTTAELRKMYPFYNWTASLV